MNRLVKEKIRKSKKNKNGYLQICLNKDGKKSYFYVHRLVATAFLKNPENKREVNHKNFDKTDNKINNLEWTTNYENMKHVHMNGIIDPRKRIETMKKRGDFNWHVKGKNNYKARAVKCLNNGKTYDYILQAAKDLNVDGSSICKVCKGKIKSLKGYIFTYA